MLMNSLRLTSTMTPPATPIPPSVAGVLRTLPLFPSLPRRGSRTLPKRRRTQSLTSSDTDFKYENGRRYHAYREGAYHLPNDENEQDRLDMQHQIYRYALDGRLYRAPLSKEMIRNVLDVGCGTGKWCIDTAEEVPHAQVQGFDLRWVHAVLRARAT